jgi:hypothetical protein
MFVRKIGLFASLFKVCKQGIAIETSKTPNPNFIKFIPVGHTVLGDMGTLDISSPQFSDVLLLKDRCHH